MTIIRKFLPLSVLIFGLSISLLAQPAVNFLSARVSLDSNGNLLVAAGTIGTQGPATNVANTRVKVDSNGNLLVALNGGATIPITNCYGFTGVSNCFGLSGTTTVIKT